MKKALFFHTIVIIFIISVASAWSANIYVDQTLPTDIINGAYSSTSRNATGSDGNAYRCIKAAIAVMNVGDTIILRGGTYQEGHIRLPYTKSGTDWTQGNYNTIMSYPGEWAVLDGQNGTGGGGIDGKVVGIDKNSQCVIGVTVSDTSGKYDLRYWKFIRLEITNGASADGEYAAGFAGNGGPFIFRHCYIHDNITTERIGSYNPGGLRGEIWHDSLVEFCYFKNNGALDTNNLNTAHINIFSDYLPNETAENGFVYTGHHTMRNEFRYNLFENSAVGIKYKQDQFFTGRNPGGGHPYKDEYKDLGDKIHHNIFLNTKAYATNGRQDFIQIYNNIFDSNEGVALSFGEIDTRTIYKAVSFNNTIINPKDRGLFRIHNALENYWDFMTSAQYFGYDYNNILDYVRDGSSWSDAAIYVRGTFPSGPDFSTYVGDRNYFYRPNPSNIKDLDGTRLYYMGGVGAIRYDINEYESLYSGKDLYRNEYNSSDLLYKGTTGADKYKTRANHVVEGSKTVANGGIGGAHPYLDGITLPSYVGATNPNGPDSGTNWDPVMQNPDDSGWVDYVLYVVGDLPSQNGNYLYPPKNLNIVSVQ